MHLGDLFNNLKLVTKKCLYQDTELLTRSEPDQIFLQCIILIDILVLAQLQRAGLKRLSNKEITQETKLKTLQKNNEMRTCGHSQTLTPCILGE